MSQGKEPVLSVRNLAKAFDDKSVDVLKDISFDVYPGDVIAILGPSGSGKSTLLRCLNRLEEPTSGQILYHGKDVKGLESNHYRAKVGMVFQSFNLFSNLTVLGNCILPQRLVLKRSKEQARAKAESNLKIVGMADRVGYFPDSISGGQKQRVAIARALCMDPDVLLFDEPTSALDPEMTNSVLQVMKGLATQGMTMVVVTHEMEFARAVANRVIFINMGYVLVSGTPKEVFENNDDERVSRFIHQKYN